MSGVPLEDACRPKVTVLSSHVSKISKISKFSQSSLKIQPTRVSQVVRDDEPRGKGGAHERELARTQRQPRQDSYCRSYSPITMRRSEMNRKSLTVGLMLSCVIALGSGKAEARDNDRAEARPLSLRGSYSGTFVNTQTDTNRDGGKASLTTSSGNGTFGESSFQCVSEYVSSPGSVTCPNGQAGVELTLLREQLPAAPAHCVQRFESTGDLLFSEFSSSTICVDLSSGIQFFSTAFQITGARDGLTGRQGRARRAEQRRPCSRMQWAITSAKSVVRIQRQ